MGQQQGPSCSITPARLKLLMCLLAAGLGFYLLVPPLYWHFAEQLEAASSGSSSSSTFCRTCPACECESVSDFHSHFSDPGGPGNVSLADCGGDFPEVQSELWSSKLQLLEEELGLQEKVAAENQERSDSAFLAAKKLASQYQKEAEKCNIGMETSEEARERAEAALLLSRKLAAQWEQRARDLGWKDGQRHFRAQSVADPHDPGLVGASSSFQDSSSSSSSSSSSRSQPGRLRRYFGGKA